ncbi:hypothetical protein C9382_22315 [Pseudomonas aylmerensis]|uniref:Uncharacterized protein n=1 Tax=Pseudomonas aylmerensis TaxID=1869229 RepID=A0A2T4FS40_9PSED|nr:hypothetical protein C9382_22315 [Pseudomonas aylmerensis]
MWWWITRWSCARCWITRCAAAEANEDLNVGAGLLAKAAWQSMNVSTDPPPSPARPLPQGIFTTLKRGVSNLLNFVEAIYV